jgi:hypothetical protein
MRRCLLLGLVLSAGCDSAPSPSAPAPAATPDVAPAPAPMAGEQVRRGPAVRTMSPADFRAVVEGRSQDDVLAAVGRPREMSRNADGAEVWVYEGVTADPKAGSTDGRVQVTFRGGRAVGVQFSAPSE